MPVPAAEPENGGDDNGGDLALPEDDAAAVAPDIPVSESEAKPSKKSSTAASKKKSTKASKKSVRASKIGSGAGSVDEPQPTVAE